MNISGQHEGILFKNREGSITICLIDFVCQARADPLALQEDHKLLHSFLFEPGLLDPLALTSTNTTDFGQSLRMKIQNVESLLSKFLDDTLCQYRPNTFQYT